MVDKPVVQYVVEELVRAGIARVLFVTGRRKRAIEDHFDADPELDSGSADRSAHGLQILYTRQARPAGLGDALRYAASFAGRAGVVVALGDAIIESPPSAAPGIVPRLIEAYEEPGAAAAIAVQRGARTRRSRVTAIAVGAPADADVRSRSRRGREARSAMPSAAARRSWAATSSGPRCSRHCARRPDASGEVQLADALQRGDRQRRPGGGGPARAGRAPARHRLGRELLRRLPRARARATPASARRCARARRRCSMAAERGGACAGPRGAGGKSLRRLRRRGAGGDLEQFAARARGERGRRSRGSSRRASWSRRRVRRFAACIRARAADAELDRHGRPRSRAGSGSAARARS